MALRVDRRPNNETCPSAGFRQRRNRSRADLDEAVVDGQPAPDGDQPRCFGGRLRLVVLHEVGLGVGSKASVSPHVERRLQSSDATDCGIGKKARPPPEGLASLPMTPGTAFAWSRVSSTGATQAMARSSTATSGPTSTIESSLSPASGSEYTFSKSNMDERTKQPA